MQTNPTRWLNQCLIEFSSGNRTHKRNARNSARLWRERGHPLSEAAGGAALSDGTSHT